MKGPRRVSSDEHPEMGTATLISRKVAMSPSLGSKRDQGGRLDSSWLTRWSNDITQAVRSLPGHPLCDHDLYLELLKQSLEANGAVAVVTKQGIPQVVLGLAPDGRWRWKNVTNWMIPGFIGATSDPRDILPAFAQSHREVFVAWWRMPVPPAGPAIQEMRAVDTHELQLADRDKFWRQGRTMKNIRHARSKCADLEITINEPGGAEWVIRSAATKWNGSSAASTLETNLRIEIARALEPTGKHVTFVLRDGDRRLAGTTNIIDGDTIVGVGLYRDESVGSLPTGVRVMAEVFDYADGHGFVSVDMGGGYDYKSHWAPASGTRYDVVVAPRAVYSGRRKASQLLKLAGG